MHTYMFKFVVNGGGYIIKPIVYPPDFVPLVPLLGSLLKARDHKGRDVLGSLSAVSYELTSSLETSVTFYLNDVAPI